MVCRLEGCHQPTGGRVLPAFCYWLEEIESYIQEDDGEDEVDDAGVGAGLSLTYVATLMRNKLVAILDDKEQVLGWMMVLLFDVSWGGVDVESVFDTITSWKVCGQEWKEEDDHITFKDSHMYREIKNELVEYMHTLYKANNLPPGTKPTTSSMSNEVQVDGGATENISSEMDTDNHEHAGTSTLSEGGHGVDERQHSLKRKTVSEATRSTVTQVQVADVSVDDRAAKRNRTSKGKKTWRLGCTSKKKNKKNTLNNACFDKKQVAREVEEYMVERMNLRTDDDVDVLGWWCDRSTRWKWLSHCAALYLAQPATSASSERLFSRGGHICRSRRARLTGEHMNMLACLSWALNCQ